MARNKKPTRKASARKAAPRSLTPKQQQFVQEYLVDLNANR